MVVVRKLVIMAFVVGYFLTLGSLEAEEHAVAFRPVPSDKVELVKKLISRGDARQDNVPDGSISIEDNVRYAEVVLKDGEPPCLFILIKSRYSCGSAGCDLDVWEKTNDGWRTILGTSTDGGQVRGKLSAAGDALRVEDATDFGYHRLTEKQFWLVKDKSGKEKSELKKEIHYFWDGTRYQDDDEDNHG